MKNSLLQLFVCIFLLCSSTQEMNAWSFSRPDTIVEKKNDNTIVTITCGKHKTVKTYGKKNNLYEERYFLHGKIEKIISYCYDKPTQIASMDIYEKGRRKLLQQYYSSGCLKSETHYKPLTRKSIESVPDGLNASYYDGNIPQYEATHKADLWDGKVTYWYPNGKLKQEEMYNLVVDSVAYKKQKAMRLHRRLNALKVWKYFKPKPKIDYISCGGDFCFSTPEERWQSFRRRNGYICNREGVFNFYNEQGGLDSCKHYHNDKIGLTTYYYPNGNKKKEINYKNLYEVDGPYAEWYENGQPKEIAENCKYEEYYTERDAKEPWRSKMRYNGRRLCYKPDGNLKWEENYLNGQRHGLFLEYYDKVNQLKQRKEFYWNSQVGDLLQYNQRGDTIRYYHTFNPKEYIDTLKSTDDVKYRVVKSNNGLLTKVQRIERGDTTEELQFNYSQEKLLSCYTYKKGLRKGFHVNWSDYDDDKIIEGFYKMQPAAKVEVRDSIEREYNFNGFIMRIYNKNKVIYSENYDTSGRITSTSYNLTFNSNRSPITRIETNYYTNGQKSLEKATICKAPYQVDNNVTISNLLYYENGKIETLVNRTLSGQLYGYRVWWKQNGQVINFTNHRSSSDYDTVNNPKLAQQLYYGYTHQPQPEGKTLNGKKEGPWVYWFDSTHKQYEMTFKHGILQGPLTIYYTNGNKAWEADVKDGIADDYTTYNADGTTFHTPYDTKLYEMPPDSLPARCFPTEYYPNGKKKQEQTFDPQTRTYTRTRWFDNGVVESEQSNSPDKDFSSFDYRSWFSYNSTLNFTYSVHSGQKDGLFTEYDGNKKIHEVLYTKGLKQGLEQVWNPYYNNLLRLCYYDKGIKNGFYKTWYQSRYKDGIVKEEGRYANDEKDSVWNYYFESGKLKETGLYRDGIKEGAWKKFDEGGHIINESYFKNGIFQHGPLDYCYCSDSSVVMPKDSLKELEENHTWFSFYEILSPKGSLANRYSSTDYLINNIYYTTPHPDKSLRGDLVPHRLIAHEPVFLIVPPVSGTKLILNPCAKSYNKASVLDFNYCIGYGDYNSGYINTRKIALEFDRRLLHRCNPVTRKPLLFPDSTYIPSWLYFNCSSLDISTVAFVNPVNQHFSYFEHAEIGDTGFEIDFDGAIFKSGQYNGFAGADVNNAIITLPSEVFASQKVVAERVLISDKSIEGEITIPVARGKNSSSFRLKKSKQNLTEEMLKKILEEKHFQIEQLHYNSSKREVTFLFNYHVVD